MSQYLPLHELDDVTNALNFETTDCRVVGSCDLYTTKAAGNDKKLYKNIEHSLESHYETILRFSASLSPPQASSAAASLNLSRSSPFGPLSQISSRRAFAYLIATMNASHPDYDFSQLLRPADFRREKNLKVVMNTLDTTLYNLRPRPALSMPDGPPHWSSTVTPAGACSPSPGQQWSPRLWQVIDKEMDLKACSIYCYSPEEDPYNSEEGTIWSFDYFFFNKSRKRVCYVYIRGLSITNDTSVPRTPISEEQSISGDWSHLDISGAKKRAKYWLGDRGTTEVDTCGWDEDDDDEMIMSTSKDFEPRLLTDYERPTYVLSVDEADSPHSGRSRSTTSRNARSRSKSTVRHMSEDIAESMDMDV